MHAGWMHMAPDVVGLAPSYCLRQLAVPVALAMVSGRTRKLNQLGSWDNATAL